MGKTGSQAYVRSPPESSYAAARSAALRHHLRPTLIVAFGMVVLHVAMDVANRFSTGTGNLAMYALLLLVPLIGFALTYLPPTILAAHHVAVMFDTAFTLVIVAFLFDSGSTVSAVTVAISLKMLATSVLFPWHPYQQGRSVIVTIALYAAGGSLSGRIPNETHQLIAPVLAGILATYACHRLDRTHHSLYLHSAELEQSERQLRSALAQDRVLLGVASSTNELTASEAAYRDLFERANDLIFVADTDGGLHFANQAALEFLAATPRELSHLRWTRFLDATQASRIHRRSRVAERRPNHEANSFEVSVTTPAGEQAILELRARLISPPGQFPQRYQCIARDVTERCRRDEETRALLGRLQESQRLQDEFVANMSHELRTPLNVIIGYADLLADDLGVPLHSDARSFLNRIGAASRALQRMVESILEYARLDRGRMMVIPTNFSSDHLLLELEALCNDVRSSFDVRLELEQDETIDFLTDYDRLYSILSNLMLNALKFTPKGTISLSLLRVGDDAEFVVRDTGIGIDPSELRYVFEPFRQVDGSDTRAFGGVGLGLAIVRRNVDLLHGTIDVASTPSEGTSFTLRIPIEVDGLSRQPASSAA